jgi:hypothetical protein
MTKLINRVADRLLAGFAPRIEAAAACYRNGSWYCYCSGGIAYRRICYVCYNPDGSKTYYCLACQASGTC